MTVRNFFLALTISLPPVIFLISLYWSPVLWSLVVIAPILLLALHDMFQHETTLLRLYPVIGRFRYMFEAIRPEIQQYFVESDTNGMPVSREFRSLVYQRAKNVRDTRPFGTIFDVNKIGYEWMNHSLSPKEPENHNPRIRFGDAQCAKPYDASPMNISAMSYGALSKNAIMALNKGAKLGGFAHNTGEGGLSPYHLEHGGDIIWQIGTGYFGCRNQDGNFDKDLFQQKATNQVVKMIEIKLSQGAKPGHGGILPAAKLTEEIAKIRHVPMGQDVVSPASHSAFSTPKGLLEFVSQLRSLSGGKPVGFKLCIGDKSEFLSLCKAIIDTGLYPDFITVDGGEGGTGAAPVELTNSVGTPLRDALVFVNNALIGIGYKDKIRIIAAGKIFSAFHMARAIALGADTINSARGMMFALGCIQSRSCNTDKCPTGIATQDPVRTKGLSVEHKAVRVAQFQKKTVTSLVELIGAAGMDNLAQLKPKHINHRISDIDVKTYEELYPTIPEDSLTSEQSIPPHWKKNWESASSTSWQT
jgi:glutamate synthase domain-containing protein 2